MGAMMGGGVGLTIGFIFGSYSILRGGAGPRGAMATLSQYMLSSAATFSFFLSIGSVIRNEELLLLPEAAGQQQKLHPLIHSRIDGMAIMRARWAMERAKARRTLEESNN
ncbi:subunit of TIM23 translocase complex [Ceratobasidium sp. 395]|nr:subunit of TIM23 translocase complex [Ceratobasidium sp. 395]